MTSMVERVARAIFAEFAEEDGYPAMSPAGKARWDAQARAAIEAMIIPTEGMIAAGSVEIAPSVAEPAYIAMITAALNEAEPEPTKVPEPPKATPYASGWTEL